MDVQQVGPDGAVTGSTYGQQSSTFDIPAEEPEVIKCVRPFLVQQNSKYR